MNRSSGFTLLEMLAVMAVIAIVAAFTLPNTAGLLKGQNLAQGGHTMADQINLARQMAIASGRAVEVRFYRYADPETPGETAGTPKSGKYRAMQVFEMLESGTGRPLAPVQRVPPSIIIDSGATLSSLLQATDGTSAPVVTDGSNLKFPIPRVERAYQAATFQFLADGSTNLPKTAGSKWFITLHSANDADGSEKPPKDFFTVQIDPVNGNLRTYRP